MMYRQVLARNVRLTTTRSPLIRRGIPLVTRNFLSTKHSYTDGEPINKKWAFAMGALATIGAVYYVQPYKKPEPKKIETIETELVEIIEEPVLENELTDDNENILESSISEELTSDEEQIIIKETQELGELEGEAKREAAYDPETGEINWDCPCLGGMADGPCGEEFKEAFSCFIYSESEPKGIDCVDKFQAMQTCFRKYPEHYADQLKDEDDAAAIDELAEEIRSSEEENGSIAEPSNETINDDLVEQIELTESN